MKFCDEVNQRSPAVYFSCTHTVVFLVKQSFLSPPCIVGRGCQCTVLVTGVLTWTVSCSGCVFLWGVGWRCPSAVRRGCYCALPMTGILTLRISCTGRGIFLCRVGRRYPSALFLLLCGISNLVAIFTPPDIGTTCLHLWFFSRSCRERKIKNQSAIPIFFSLYKPKQSKIWADGSN